MDQNSMMAHSMKSARSRVGFVDLEMDGTRAVRIPDAMAGSTPTAMRRQKPILTRSVVWRFQAMVMGQRARRRSVEAPMPWGKVSLGSFGGIGTDVGIGEGHVLPWR